MTEEAESLESGENKNQPLQQTEVEHSPVAAATAEEASHDAVVVEESNQQKSSNATEKTESLLSEEPASPAYMSLHLDYPTDLERIPTGGAAEEVFSLGPSLETFASGEEPLQSPDQQKPGCLDGEEIVFVDNGVLQPPKRSATIGACETAVVDGEGTTPEQRKRRSVRFQKMSSIMNEGFAILEEHQFEPEEGATSVSATMPSRRSMTRSGSILRRRHTFSHASDPEAGVHATSAPALMAAQRQVEPFIASLQKSVRILSVEGASQHPNEGGENDLDMQVVEEGDDEDASKNGTSKRNCFYNLQWMSVLYLSAFSILGCFLRVFLDRLFGGICSDNDTYSWLYSVSTSSNLCITSDGEENVVNNTDNGALFVDLPANMLGSFLMGLFQPSGALGLLNTIPVASLPAGSFLQSWEVMHFGLRTGFCGSLTTLASWNTQMIGMLLDGEIAAALFGYIVGLELALASFVLGQQVAIWKHRWLNPLFAREEDLLMFAYSKQATDHQKKVLPDYERRYLASLLPLEQRAWARQHVQALEDLEKWKSSTDPYRQQQSSSTILHKLHEIERQVLIEQQRQISPDLFDLAIQHGWDVESLQRFAKTVEGVFASSTSMTDLTAGSKKNKTSACRKVYVLVRDSIWALWPFAIAIGLTVMFGVFDYQTRQALRFAETVDSEWQAAADYYQSMWLSAVMSPFGTLVRWKLSRLNSGFLLSSYNLHWLPLGTLLANIVASLISALAAALSETPELLPWSIAAVPTITRVAVLFAIKTGLAGCMSTVSTFVAESAMLHRTFPQSAKTVYYLVGTLVCTCLLSLTLYGPMVTYRRG